MNQLRFPMQLYYAWPNEKLLAYLDAQEAGNPEVIESPFGEGEGFEDLLDAWDQILRNVSDDWPTLYQYEMESRAKAGPQSGQKPLSDRMAAIREYYTAANLKAQPVDEQAISALLKSWSSVVGIRTRDRHATIAKMKKSTNSGSPFFTVKRNVTELEYNAFYELKGDKWVVTYPNLGSWILCATLGWKGDMGGPTLDDVKQRVLWMFAYDANVEELRYYQPFEETIISNGLIPAWNGPDAVDVAMTKLMATKGKETPMICTDFKAFDQHFGKAMQDCALTVFENIFRQEDTLLLRKTLGYKYIVPLCISKGVFLFGPHGMSSGSGGTAADETTAHKALQFEVAIKHGKTLNPYSMCSGDDGILSYPGIRVEDVIESYTSHGLEMQPAKQHVSSEDAIFLRRWFHVGYKRGAYNVGVYPTMRALGKLRYPRRSTKSWSRKSLAMRALSIIENCKHHPLFYQFVEFCAKRDKFRLGLDIPGFMENLDEEYLKLKAEGALDLSYLQEKENKSPSNWEVVHVLRLLK